LAKIFHRNAETMYQWLADGSVFPNAFRVKDGWFVPEKDVKQLMKSRQGKGFVGGWK
jgi:hypothetical protein